MEGLLNLVLAVELCLNHLELFALVLLRMLRLLVPLLMLLVSKLSSFLSLALLMEVSNPVLYGFEGG